MSRSSVCVCGAGEWAVQGMNGGTDRCHDGLEQEDDNRDKLVFRSRSCIYLCTTSKRNAIMDLSTPSLTSEDESSSFASSLEDRPLPPLPPLPPRLSRKPISFPDLPILTPPKSFSPLLKSKAWRNMHKNVVLALRQSRILARLISYTTWDDLYALFTTCSGTRRLWHFLDTRDLILSHYLPGYRTALRHRDLSALQPVDVTLHDLHLLCSSLLILFTYALTIPCFSTFTTCPTSSVSYARPRRPLQIPCPWLVQRRCNHSNDHPARYPC